MADPNKDSEAIPVFLLRCFLTAIRFLTIFPTFVKDHNDAKYFRHAVYFFPLTGLLAGILISQVHVILTSFFPALVCAILSTVFLSMVSGFLHLDGLADTADGFMSSRPADRCLEIMKDSRIGVMGAAAIPAVFMMKAAALASIPAGQAVATLILMPIAGRSAIVISMALLPYARKEGGLGELFYSGSTRKAALMSAVIYVISVMVLAPVHWILPVLGLILVVSVSALFCQRRIGGATGDTLGAVCELSEAAVLIFCTIS